MPQTDVSETVVPQTDMSETGVSKTVVPQTDVSETVVTETDVSETDVPETVVPETELRRRLAARFREVNGDHPMTADDDAYVSAQFVVLEELCAARGHDGDRVRRLMLDGRLPLPGYLRSDGAEMVPADLFALADEAGGVDRLEAWFTGHWADPATGRAEWAAYLSGQYVCLHSVTPAAIRRKEHLVAAIGAAEDEPDAGSVPWLRRLHDLIDELDLLEPAFTAYDRLRFGGPTSRDIRVTAMRARFPRPAPVRS